MINEQIDMNVPKVELMEASKLRSSPEFVRKTRLLSEFFWK